MKNLIEMFFLITLLISPILKAETPSVSKIPLDIFQERLIHHFDLRFKKNDINWPQRKKRKLNTDE